MFCAQFEERRADNGGSDLSEVQGYMFSHSFGDFMRGSLFSDASSSSLYLS